MLSSMQIHAITLASSAAIAYSFTAHRLPPPPPTPTRFRAEATTSSSTSTSTSVLTGTAALAEIEMDEAGGSATLSPSEMEQMAKGYEYIHPDITAMLQTKGGHQSDDDDDDDDDDNNDGSSSSFFPFSVDTDTLTLKRVPKLRNDDDDDDNGDDDGDGVVENPAADTMSMNPLARLADECDRIVFGATQQHKHTIISKKIMGLICLSQLPSSPTSSTTSTEVDEKKNDGDVAIAAEENPAIMVANMMALNLLESSIRAMVMRYRSSSRSSNTGKNIKHDDDDDDDDNDCCDNNGGSNKKSKPNNNHAGKDTSTNRNNGSKKQRRPSESGGSKGGSKGGGGAPLLKDMIQEIADMEDRFSLPNASNFNSSAAAAATPSTPSTIKQESVISARDLAPILRALLLPTRAGGINLRNLVSHGFLSTIDRRWFSLTLVLMQTLDSLLLVAAANNTIDGGIVDDESQEEEEDKIANVKVEKKGKRAMKGGNKTSDQDKDGVSSSLTKYAPMANEVCNGKRILLQKDTSLHELERQAEEFIPSSHMPILRFSLQVLAPSIAQSLDTTINNEGNHSIKTPTTSINNNKKKNKHPPLTAIFTTVACALLEHSLRLLWCKTNSRPADRIARPSAYYVTLDGHGQRDKHEVLLTPRLKDGRTNNELMPTIGAPALALLSDLFAAPAAEAPNIRSAVCHGRWDGEIARELEGLAEGGDDDDDDDTAASVLVGNCGDGVEGARGGRSNAELMDSACALVSCLGLIAGNVSGRSGVVSPSCYRPVYTYTATAVRNLNEIFRNLEELEALMTNNSSISECIGSMKEQQPKLCDDLKSLKLESGEIKEMACDLFPTLSKDDGEPWCINDTYTEHQTNIVMADNIAALSLLSDVSRAMTNYLAGIRERIDKLENMQPRSTKDRRMLKTASRFCSAAMVVRDFYVWTTYVALMAVRHSQNKPPSSSSSGGADYLPKIENTAVLKREDIVRATERSRMAISTFDSHITMNLDRSMKALQQYLQGKVLKKVILHKKM